eukprot:4778742-Amphidinium_carterae.1
MKISSLRNIKDGWKAQRKRKHNKSGKAWHEFFFLRVVALQQAEKDFDGSFEPIFFSTSGAGSLGPDVSA